MTRRHWLDIGEEYDSKPSWHDEMQVCLNGHKITEYAKSSPEFRQQFCAKCGERTIQACEDCRTPLKGHYHVDGVFSVSDKAVPDYCSNCGKPYPWREAAVENLQDIIRDSGLEDADVEALEVSLPDILRDTPKTESAALRFKRILGKLGKPAYDVAIRVVTDIASETAKKSLGLG